MVNSAEISPVMEQRGILCTRLPAINTSNAQNTAAVKMADVKCGNATCIITAVG